MSGVDTFTTQIKQNRATCNTWNNPKCAHRLRHLPRTFTLAGLKWIHFLCAHIAAVFLPPLSNARRYSFQIFGMAVWGREHSKEPWWMLVYVFITQITNRLHENHGSTFLFYSLYSVFFFIFSTMRVILFFVVSPSNCSYCWCFPFLQP